MAFLLYHGASTPRDQRQSGLSEKKNIRTQGLISLGSAVRTVAKPVFAKRPKAEVALLESWAQIAGPVIANWARPESLRFARRSEPRQGTLVLKVDRAFATDLQHLEGQLVERVNAFFGYAAVKDIRLFQVQSLPERTKREEREAPAPIAPDPEAEAKAAGVADERLRGALARLGAAVKAKSEKPQDRD